MDSELRRTGDEHKHQTRQIGVVMPSTTKFDSRFSQHKQNYVKRFLKEEECSRSANKNEVVPAAVQQNTVSFAPLLDTKSAISFHFAIVGRLCVVMFCLFVKA
jgi:hypothetical protein